MPWNWFRKPAPIPKEPLADDQTVQHTSIFETKGDWTASAQMHAFAREKLTAAVILLNFPQLLDRLEDAYEGGGRLLYQALPIRIYIYDLTTAAGRFEFERETQSGRDPQTILEVASLKIEGQLVGYFLYALGIVDGYPDRNRSDLPEQPFDVATDWARLLKYRKDNDVALSIPWLKQMYGTAVIQFLEFIESQTPTHQLAEAMAFLKDDSFKDFFDKILSRQGTSPETTEAKAFLTEMLSRTSDGQKRRNLRDNMLIACIFAFQSPLFSSLTLERVKPFLAQEAGSHVAVEDISQLVDFYNFALTSDEIAARAIAEITYHAAKNVSDAELKAYAAYNLGALLATKDSVEEQRAAIAILKESRELFRTKDPEHAALTAIRVTLKKLTALRSNEETSGDQDSAEYIAALKDYNGYISQHDFAGAVRTLDAALDQLEKDTPQRIDLEALAGGALLGQHRLDLAFKRLYTCQNLIAKGVRPPDKGYFEAFEINLFHAAGQFADAIDAGKKGLRRLEHRCGPQMLSALVNSTAVCMCENGGADEASELIEQYLPFAKGSDELYMKSNLALVSLLKGDYEDTLKRCSALLKSDAAHTDTTLQFDLNFNSASALLEIAKVNNAEPALARTTLESVRALLPEVPEAKVRGFYALQARLDRLTASRAQNLREALEAGFQSAERNCDDVGRLADDINDRGRLLTSLSLKVESFPEFLELVGLYIQDRDWSALFDFIQRFKARFLIESTFSNSENMVAAKTAQRVAKRISEGDQLKDLQLWATLIKIGSPGKVREAAVSTLLQQGEIFGGEPVLPISVEHVEADILLPVLENLDRGVEIKKSRSSAFISALLSKQAAIVEFFPIDVQRFGALAFTHNGLKFLGEYAIASGNDFSGEHYAPNSTPEMRDDIDQRFQEDNRDLRRNLEEVAKSASELILCPSGILWNRPLHALLMEDGTPLGLHTHVIYAPSSSIYALCRARQRKWSNFGFALVAPHDDLSYSEAESHVLANCDVAFGKIQTHPLMWEDLKNSASGCFWLHFSAHGYRGRGNGFMARLGTGPISGKSEYEDLSAASAFYDYFPGLSTSVVVLSSCSSGEICGMAEESLGLPSMLLTGGAKAVIAPLWEVDEMATLIFMELFYSGLRSSGTVAASLGKAQTRMRDLTTNEIIGRIHAMPGGAGRDPIRYAEWLVGQYQPEQRPYSTPFYWSAFALFGCDVSVYTI